MKWGVKECNKYLLQDSVGLLKVGWLFTQSFLAAIVEREMIISCKNHKLTKI